MEAVRIAIPVFKNRVSPLFDVAGFFLIYLVTGETIEKKYSFHTAGESDCRLIERLLDENIDVLICSAISKSVSTYMENCGVVLIKGIIGQVDEVIDAYCKKELHSEKFIMPGCVARGGNKNQMRRRMGHCARQNKNKCKE